MVVGRVEPLIAGCGAGFVLCLVWGLSRSLALLTTSHLKSLIDWTRVVKSPPDHTWILWHSRARREMPRGYESSVIVKRISITPLPGGAGSPVPPVGGLSVLALQMLAC